MDKNNDIMQEAIDARIDSFLRGEMTPEEETAFKQEIQADPELRAQVQATVALIRGIRNQNAGQEKKIVAKYNHHRVRTLLAWGCSIAAMEPIYLALDSDFTYSAYANDIAWNLALAYIKDDQIDKAIPILEKLETDNPDMPIAVKASELKKKIQE